MYRDTNKVTNTLDQLKQDNIAWVDGFIADNALIEAKLREIGFAEDDEVELVQRGPLTARALCFRLNSTLIALRRDEAAAIRIRTQQ